MTGFVVIVAMKVMKMTMVMMTHVWLQSRQWHTGSSIDLHLTIGVDEGSTLYADWGHAVMYER